MLRKSNFSNEMVLNHLRKMSGRIMSICVKMFYISLKFYILLQFSSMLLRSWCLIWCNLYTVSHRFTLPVDPLYGSCKAASSIINSDLSKTLFFAGL